MKRLLSVFLATILLLLSISTTVTAASVYKVRLDVNFVGNLVFSTYDIDLYLNDLHIEQLSHGKNYSGTFYADAGSNTLYFYKQGDKSVTGTLKLDITENTTVKCTIYCSHDEITVRDVKITTGAVEPEATAISEAVITEAPIELAETELEQGDNNFVGERTVKTVSFSDIDLTSMSDEELSNALDAIKAEQRSRIKTKISFDKSEIVLLVGKSEKISATVVDLPEGEKTPKLEWSTSDKSIVTCKNGQIRAVAGGNAVIICSATLADGTFIYEECKIQVNVAVSSLNTEKKSIDINVDDTFTPVFTIKPDNASNKSLMYESSKPDVAFVSSTGTIIGKGEGNAVITVYTTDGSEKKITINVKVTDTTVKEPVITPNVGDIVRFGHYEQDNDRSNGKETIEWIVLDVQDDRALLLSKYGLDNMDYGEQNASITWEKSIIRTWLNKTFLKEAFSAEEQKAILTTNVDNSKKQGNSKWKTKGGNNTEDKLFLLSYHEVFEVYLTSNEARLCAPTDYVDPYNYNRARLIGAVKVDGRAAYTWWLRSPGMEQNRVVNVSREGNWLDSSPTPKGTNYLLHLIRPAMWLDITNETINRYDQIQPLEKALQDFLKDVSDDSSEIWFTSGCGMHLPKFRLLSGDELQFGKDMHNDEESFSVTITNATPEDYNAYIELLKGFGYTNLLDDGVESYDALNEENYEVFVYFSDEEGLLVVCESY